MIFITAESIVLYYVHTKKYAINSTGTIIYIFYLHVNLLLTRLTLQWFRCDSNIVMSVRLRELQN